MTVLEVLQSTTAYLKKRDIEFTESEFAQNRQWISDQIQIEMFTRAFDRKSADRSC